MLKMERLMADVTKKPAYISLRDDKFIADFSCHEEEPLQIQHGVRRVIRVQSLKEGHNFHKVDHVSSCLRSGSFHVLFPHHLDSDRNKHIIAMQEEEEEEEEKEEEEEMEKSESVLTPDPSQLAESFHVMLRNQSEWEMEVRTQRRRLPFLMRFHAGHFRICLGLAAQTVLFKELSGASFFPLRAPWWGMLALWIFSLLVLVVLCGIYLTKCVRHMDIVKMEYQDRVRVNYFFVPWICGMILSMGYPGDVKKTPDVVHRVLWWVFMTPVAAMEAKLYGQWFTKGKTFLSRIANPSTHLSVIGNFVGARMAVHAEWGELAMFFYTVGIVHYLVIFITLYQRLPTSTALPKNNHPIFFLFMAAPSVSAVAWQDVYGVFNTPSKMQYFLSLFLYCALMVRVKFFEHAMKSFGVSWWAYAYPMTTVAIAAVRYAMQQKQPIAEILALILSAVSVLALIILLCLTIIDMVFCKQGLFPNDFLIISTHRKNVKTYQNTSKTKSKESVKDKYVPKMLPEHALHHKNVSSKQSVVHSVCEDV